MCVCVCVKMGLRGKFQPFSTMFKMSVLTWESYTSEHNLLYRANEIMVLLKASHKTMRHNVL